MLSTILREGDVIDYEETVIPTLETVLDLSSLTSYATITYEGKEHHIPAAGQLLTINGQEASPDAIIEDGAVIVYQKGTGTANVSEALLAVGFTPPPATSRVTFAILVNGVRADFTSPIRTGDTLEVVLTPIDALSAASVPAATKAADAAPAASAILSGIAARTAMAGINAKQPAESKENSTHTEPATLPAHPKSGSAISIDSLMRYD